MTENNLDYLVLGYSRFCINLVYQSEGSDLGRTKLPFQDRARRTVSRSDKLDLDL